MKNPSHNRFGLTERDMQTLQAVFVKYPEVEQVHIFGSRAKGNHRNGSDIDLAIMTPGVSDKIIASIRSSFEESSLPYKIDLINFPTLKQSDFIDHIKRVGKLIYSKVV